MNISAKEAYELVKKEAEGFLITGCLELSDRYLFGWCQTDGTAIMLPPICVFKKTGEVTLHDEGGVAFLNGTSRETGKEISIEELELT